MGFIKKRSVKKIVHDEKMMIVIRGWFFTALLLLTALFIFTVLSVSAVAISHGSTLAAVVIATFAVLLVLCNRFLHKLHEVDVRATEVFTLRKIRDTTAAINVSFEHTGIFIQEVRRALAAAFDCLFEQDLHKLRSSKRRQERIQQWANIITANVFKILRLLQWEGVRNAQSYAETIGPLQRIANSQRDLVMRAHMHVSHSHLGLLDTQVRELYRIRTCVMELLDEASSAFMKWEPLDEEFIESKNQEIENLIKEFNRNQIIRIHDNTSKTHLSVLFYGFMWNSQRIAKQLNILTKVLKDPLRCTVDRRRRAYAS